MSEATEIVNRLAAGDVHASAELLPLVYDELRMLAHKRLANDGEGMLQTTELVHEAYLRLVGPDQQWEGRSHFFGAAAEAMRRVLVDRARRRNREKRGGGTCKRVEMHDSATSKDCSVEELLAVNDLFERLGELHPQEAEVAKLRYFVGFNHQEIAAALEIPVSTAHHYWTFAKAWLYREFRKLD